MRPWVNVLAALSSLALPGVVIPSISWVSSGGRVVSLATSWSGVLWLLIFFFLVCLFVCLFFSSSLVINVYLAYCWVGNMCPCQLSVSGFEGNLFALSRPGRPMIAALALMGLPSLTTNFMFCHWKISAVDKHVFWCHFQMDDDYLSCFCFWKIKDSWFHWLHLSCQ